MDTTTTIPHWVMVEGLPIRLPPDSIQQNLTHARAAMVTGVLTLGRDNQHEKRLEFLKEAVPPSVTDRGDHEIRRL